MWNCPWRIEWRSPREYWDRSQLGPFYVLHRKPRGYWEAHEAERAADEIKEVADGRF